MARSLPNQLEELMTSVDKAVAAIRQSKVSHFSTMLYGKCNLAKVIYEDSQLSSTSDQLIAQVVAQFQDEISNPLLNMSGLVALLKLQLNKVKAESLEQNRNHRAALSERLASFVKCYQRHMLKFMEMQPSGSKEELDTENTAAILSISRLANLAIDACNSADERDSLQQSFKRQLMGKYRVIHWCWQGRAMRSGSGKQWEKEKLECHHQARTGSDSSVCLLSDDEAQEEMMMAEGSLIGSVSVVEMDTFAELPKSEGPSMVEIDDDALEMETEAVHGDEPPAPPQQGNVVSDPSEAERKKRKRTWTNGATTILKRKRPLSDDDGTKQPRME